MQQKIDKPRKTALVTGASYGLGRAIAVRLAQDGFDVVVTDLDPTDLDETIASIEATGAVSAAIALDLGSESSVDQAFAAALDVSGEIDVLVNNAGVLLAKPALETTRSEWRDVMNINVDGTFQMSRQMGRHLVGTGREGAIINLSSTFAAIGSMNVSAYGVSKTAIAGITRHLAIEWAEYGIRVNAICPGTVETRIRKTFMAENPTRRAAGIQRIPLKRFAEPEDVAGAAAYLASDEARYLTGQLHYVDGGLTMS